jgi:hypothetical protein
LFCLVFQVYDDTSLQRVVYDDIAYPLVESVIEGYNGTIFAYVHFIILHHLYALFELLIIRLFQLWSNWLREDVHDGR